MKRKIVVIIEGEVSELFTYWKPSQEIKVEITQDGKRLETVFTNSNLSEFYNLENLVNQLKEKHEIELISFFKSYDFSEEDIKTSELLWLLAAETKGLEFDGPRPIKEYNCEKCHQVYYQIEKIDQINLRLQRSFIKPESYILSVGSIKLFHRDIIEKMKFNKAESTFKTIPCLIKGYNDILIEDYSWVYSTIDLGLPTEGVIFGEVCTKCKIPEFLEDRSFIKTFKRENWHGEDVCTSSFFGEDSLYLSQRVFRLIESLPSDIKGDITFRPIRLI